jgi:energy-coupling factor transport system ATP-binding protein
MLNGLLIPDQGEVRISGQSTAEEDNIWSIRQQVGMVFQNPDNQLVANIVEEDVAFGPENLGLKPKVIRQRVTEALEVVEMEKYRRYAPHNLSGGQKQRIAIAGILALQPNCLVLDEPTAMLDPVGRKKVISTIHELNQELEMTIVYITHLMTEVIKADRIIVLNEGQIVLQGAPREIFQQVDEIKKYNLDLPQVTELAAQLIAAGVELPDDIFEVDRLVDELCSLR